MNKTILPTAIALTLVIRVAAALPDSNDALLAHWTFDETSGDLCRDVTGNGADAAISGVPPGITRTLGVLRGALSFDGTHRLVCALPPRFGPLPQISLSAWVQPTAFDRYNEIFRKEDGNNRILFSFQEHGTVLALGLNVNGYVECDATIDPKPLLDGGWHHCAATFDGKAMRVFLDGVEIGRLNRPGTIAAGGPAPAAIASANGHECLKGGMDDLRIHSTALSPSDVAALYAAGVDLIARSKAASANTLAALYSSRDSFPETLAASRRNFIEKQIALDATAARAFLARLQTRFPDECRQFRLWTNADPVAYLRAEGNTFHLAVTERLIGMLMEYRPLTRAQMSRQSDADRARWKKAAELEARFASLKAAGEGTQCSTEWILLMRDVAQNIQWRPHEYEPVAPFVLPSTPATRDLSPDDGRRALERDWLAQTDGKPTLECIAREIQCARDLAARLPSVDLSAELGALSSIAERAGSAAPNATSLYLQTRTVKRSIMLKNPALDFRRVVFVDMPFPAGKEWKHETRHRLGYMAVPGARLLVLDGLRPDGKLTQLMPQPPLHGAFWRPDVSFDGDRILFCHKPHNEKSFHLYEMNADGTAPRQLTEGPFDDLDPVYLPDGHILFSSTRAHTYVRCMPPTSAFVLARCDPDGRNIRILSANNEPDYLPTVMNDGRVIYTRWEYTDKPLWRAQKLWTVNPDGTQVQMFWGNQSVWPDVMKDARAIPGSRRVMFTGCGHHDWFAGSIGIVDPDGGRDFPHGLTKVTAEVPWPECGNGPTDPVESTRYHAPGMFTAYYSPYPLNEREFLVSAARGGTFSLYLMDIDGNAELIFEGANNIFHAMPVRPRPMPPVVPDRVAWPSPDDDSPPRMA